MRETGVPSRTPSGSASTILRHAQPGHTVPGWVSLSWSAAAPRCATRLKKPGSTSATTELRLPSTALELVSRGNQLPVPLGDDFDGVVGHFDGGLVVDRVRRAGDAGRPAFRVGHRVPRQVV